MPSSVAVSAADSGPSVRTAAVTRSSVSAESPFGRGSGSTGSEGAEHRIDLGLRRGTRRLAGALPVGAVLLEPVAEHREREGLDQVLRDAEPHHLADDVGVAHSGDGDHVDVGRARPHVPQHVESGPVGHRHVQQHQVDALRGRTLEDRRDGGPRPRALGDDPEAVEALEVGAMQFERERVVVDEQHLDHALLPGRMTWNVVGSSDTSTAPPDGLHDRADEREADASTFGSGRLRREAVLEDALAQLGRHAAAGIRHRDLQGSSGRGGEHDAHGARLGAGGGGIQRVVDQVPHHRHRIDRAQGAPRSGRVDLGGPLHAALARLRGLAQQQRADRGVAVAARGDLIDQFLALAGGLGQDADRFVRPTQFEQRDGGVHAVSVLVRLRAQRLAERADRLVRRDRIPHGAGRQVSGDPAGEPAGEPGCGQPHRRQGDGDRDHERHLSQHSAADAAERDAGRDQRHDLAAVGHRHDRPQGRAEGSHGFLRQ